MNLTHSNGESGVLRPTTSLDVRFISTPTLQIQIKNANAMKPSATPQNEMIVPSLFQIAAHFEDIATAAGWNQPAARLSQTPFAGLMLHPEKLVSLLKFSKSENDPAAAPRINGSSPSQRAARSTSSNNRAGTSVETPSSHSFGEFKKTEFFLKAPAAKSVKLAADFTDWEKSSLDMMQSEDGVWFSIIPLEPGQYPYRFIVDGQWRDDPRATQRVPNPFGTENAVIVVT